MRTFPIVAFMQNAWFKWGTDAITIHKYVHDQEFHQRILASSMSGRRLMSAFGGVNFKKIWWDNTTPIPATQPSGIEPADYEHMGRVIEQQRPLLILGFGKQAQVAVINLDAPIPAIFCHHPNARGKTQADLDKFAMTVMAYGLLL